MQPELDGSDPALAEKLARLEACLRELAPLAVAFSGGVDSSLLYSEGRRVLGTEAIAVVGVSESLGQDELRHARRVCAEVGGELLEVSTRELAQQAYRSNDGSRCYYCKSELWRRLAGHRDLEGYALCDGTNADDPAADRPGMVAGREFGVASPLRVAELGKVEIRALARLRGLSVWDRPARPCLASRVRVGTPVSAARLSHVEELERILSRWGFRIYRARVGAQSVSIELGAEELHRRDETEWRREFWSAARRLGYHQEEALATVYAGRVD